MVKASSLPNEFVTWNIDPVQENYKKVKGSGRGKETDEFSKQERHAVKRIENLILQKFENTYDYN